MRETERWREKEEGRKRERQTDRQRDRPTDRETGRQRTLRQEDADKTTEAFRH